MKKIIMAKEIIYLLNQNDLPRLTSISGNIDIDYIKPYVKMAQDSNLKTILGEQLYKKIENDFESDSLAGDYLTIYDEYIVDMLVYYSAYYLISFHNYKISNNGILKASPENQETIDNLDIEKIASKYLQLGASVELRFNQEKHKYNIPELQSKNCGDANSGSYQMNWFL
ncbi:DUF6712 family protein [Paenimyroides baculatum]|uniref:DUF1320 domain-containing protein n=1 Tax=Paenimyroides baculatum TaxID=2608000 RepID=A0A5M6CGZ6_9FLAO|nr:hypothetical protein [Paenimyroides baculatum]KAA5534297.1 hypothetical protein F0460_09320 [Paenimyroides baculatum]